MPAVLSLVVFLSLVWLFYCPLFSWAKKATRKLWTNVFGSSACFANWLCFSIGGILAWKGVDLVSYRYMGGRKKLSLWKIPPSVFPALPQSPLPRSDTVSWQHCNKEGKETHCYWKGKKKNGMSHCLWKHKGFIDYDDDDDDDNDEDDGCMLNSIQWGRAHPRTGQDIPTPKPPDLIDGILW